MPTASDLIAVTTPKAAAISQIAAHQRYRSCVAASSGASGALAVGVCVDGGRGSAVAMAVSPDVDALARRGRERRRPAGQRMLPVCPSE
jgi:ABC-type sulfate transport system substrate-binding protein